jgi:hypothetical protein
LLHIRGPGGIIPRNYFPWGRQEGVFCPKGDDYRPLKPLEYGIILVICVNDLIA